MTYENLGKGTATDATDYYVPFKKSISSTSLFGLGCGYFFTNHIQVNTNIDYGVAKMTAAFPPHYPLGTIGTNGTNGTVLAYDIGLEVNVLKTRLTPVICGGIGFMDFNGNLGKATGVSYNEMDFASDIGAGLRWDITNGFFVKGLYKVNYMRPKDADRTLSLDGFELSAGMSF